VAYGYLIRVVAVSAPNFSQYKTYSWLKVQAGDSLWAERIQLEVDAQLAAKVALRRMPLDT
jgi:hypothetical protein